MRITIEDKSNIPTKGDNFDILSIAEPLRLPLTDMECGLISALFLYSELKFNGIAYHNGTCYKVTDFGQETVNAIFTVLMSAVNCDERAIDKMNEYTRLLSLSREVNKTRTQKGDSQLS